MKWPGRLGTFRPDISFGSAGEVVRLMRRTLLVADLDACFGQCGVTWQSGPTHLPIEISSSASTLRFRC
ncbi:hypothetical protein MPLDJ20_140420 [Mesorhizobium plurifarium]|uniref:Uncharacterized protein n=1 Tax=Mesorhizobium plurifarium TaxID=69974 RepID=A0A090ERR8_MESPL|nr:hypothetical protein MPLDJ20_140420 [Mesorhizobium plurifarium]